MIYIITEGGFILNILSDGDKEQEQLIAIIDYETDESDKDQFDTIFGSKACITLHNVLPPKDENAVKELRLLKKKYKPD